MFFLDCNKQRGFIALMSAIIIAVVLMTLVVAVSFTGFFGRFDILDSEIKEVSQGLAEACVQTAIVKYAQDNSYNPADNPNDDGIINVGGNECEIVSVETVSGDIVIKTTGIYPPDGLEPSYTNLEVEITPSGSDYVITAWREVAVHE